MLKLCIMQRVNYQYYSIILNITYILSKNNKKFNSITTLSPPQVNTK